METRRSKARTTSTTATSSARATRRVESVTKGKGSTGSGSRSRSPPPSRRTSKTSGNGSGSPEADNHLVALSQYSQLNDERDVNFLIQFVLPHDHSKTSCPETLKASFKLCKEYNLICDWIEEEHFKDVIPMPGNIFVLDPFEGQAYEHLKEELKKSKNFLVIGPQCLNFSLQRTDTEMETGILQRGYPMYTLGMRNLVISLSGFRAKGLRAELSNLIRKMGGFPVAEFTLATTHLVTDNLLSEKCAYAYKRGLPVMTEEWIKEIWTHSLNSAAHATDSDFVKFECPIFYNLAFCVSQINAIQKAQMKKVITSNGGNYSAELIKDKTNILVVPKGEGDKYRFAVQWGIPCVSPTWVTASKEAGHVIEMDAYRVNPAKVPLSSTVIVESKLHAPFPDLTSCSIIANATDRLLGNGGPNATRMKNRNFSIVSEASAVDFETIKDASLVGPFLDGCKVYLSHLSDPDKFEEVRKLLNGSGATRLNQLTEVVSHVVVMGNRISDKELEILKRLDPRPHVVGFEWLTASARLGSPAEEEFFQFIYEDDEDEDFNNVPRNGDRQYSLALGGPPQQSSTPKSRTSSRNSASRTSTSTSIPIVKKLSVSGLPEPEQASFKSSSRNSKDYTVDVDANGVEETETSQSQTVTKNRAQSQSSPLAPSTPKNALINHADLYKMTPIESPLLTGLRTCSRQAFNIQSQTPPQTQSQSLPSPYTPQNEDSFAGVAIADTTTSDSPLFAGLSRAASRQIKTAISRFCDKDKDNPNKTLDEMRITIPRKESESHEQIANGFFAMLKNKYPVPTTPKNQKQNYNILNVCRVSAEGTASTSKAKPPEPLQSLNGTPVAPALNFNKNIQHPGVEGGVEYTAVTSVKGQASPNEKLETVQPASRKRSSETPSEEESDSDNTNELSVASISDLRRGSTAPVSIKTAKYSTSCTASATATNAMSANPKTGKVSVKQVSSVVNLKEGRLSSSPQDRERDRREIPEALVRSAEKKRQKSYRNSIGWAEGRMTKLCFMFTGVSEEDKQHYTKIINSLGGSVNSSAKFSENIDGLIAGNLARSEKVLCAIASGKRILRPTYLTSSQNSGIFLGDPDTFIWGFGDGRSQAEELLATASAYWYRRISSDSKEKPFSKFHALVLDQSQSKMDAYKNLITAGGGTIYEISDVDSVNIIICDSLEVSNKFFAAIGASSPNVLVKPALCLHEIITSQCAPCSDEYFDI